MLLTDVTTDPPISLWEAKARECASVFARVVAAYAAQAGAVAAAKAAEAAEDAADAGTRCGLTARL